MKLNSLYKIFFLSIFFLTSLFSNSEYIIKDVKDGKTGYINLGNLKVGQSGIVINKTTSPIIIASAFVVESNENKTKLQFTEFVNLKQDAIPNTNLQVSNGDMFILNYLYEASMVISPNIDAFQDVRHKFEEFSFLHPDLFASYLKVEEKVIPTKELILKYANEQNLGSIVFVIENMAYLVDTKTFKVVEKKDLKYENVKSQKPFYSRIKKIETGSFDFGEESIGDYTKYYKNLLEIK